MTTQHDPDAARLGPRVENWMPPPHPKGITLDGRYCRLVPLSADDHGADLFAANAKDTAASGWDYLPYGPFAQVDDYKDWIKTSSSGDDLCFFAVEHKGLQCWAGVASYLRINPQEGSIGWGISAFPIAAINDRRTETMFLMMRWAFDQGYQL